MGSAMMYRDKLVSAILDLIGEIVTSESSSALQR